MVLDADQIEDDAVLVQRFAQGDADAARSLMTRLTPIVYAQAFRMMGNQAEAEDVTQDALMRLWKAAPTWEPDRARVTTWLYRVTSNLCIDRLRRSKFQSGDEVGEQVDETPGAVQTLQREQRRKALRQALLKLPERQRQAMILRHLEELSNPEISQIMDISVEAVESLLSRGKRMLTKILTPQKHALGLDDDPKT